MDRARKRRGFPLFKHALMATFALAGGWKGLFDGALRHSWFLRECAAVRPVSEKQRNHHDRRTHSNLHTDRVSHHHLSFCFDFLAGCGISQFIHNPSFESYINGSDVKRTSGCSKRLSSKAAASEEARRTLRYVEPLSDARTPLGDFFNILLAGQLAVANTVWLIGFLAQPLLPICFVLAVVPFEPDHLAVAFE